MSEVFLLGSGPLLLEAANFCLTQGKKPHVFISPRHAEEKHNGLTLVQALEKLKITPCITEKIDGADTQKLLAPMKDGIAISIGAAWIFTKAIIENSFHNRLYNVHGTRLPRDRGGASLTWQILRGNRTGASLIHQVDPGIDTGGVVAFEEYIIPSHCRLPIDFRKVAFEKNTLLIRKFLGDFFAGKKPEVLFQQAEHLSTYFPRLSTAINAWVNWDWSALEIDRFICAFDDPYDGVSTRWNGQVVKLKKSQMQQEDGAFHPFQTGLVYRNNGKWISVVVPGGQLLIEEVIDEKGENILSKIPEGDRFYCNPTDLFEAKKRVFFTPKGMRESKL